MAWERKGITRNLQGRKIGRRRGQGGTGIRIHSKEGIPIFILFFSIVLFRISLLFCDAKANRRYRGVVLLLIS